MSLSTFCASKGTAREAVAVLVGVEPLLLERIDQGRQPLPLSLASRIASALGVLRGDVVAEVSSVTPLSGEELLRPVPPDFIRGDPIPVLQLRDVASLPVPDFQSAQVSPIDTAHGLGLPTIS